MHIEPSAPGRLVTGNPYGRAGARTGRKAVAGAFAVLVPAILAGCAHAAPASGPAPVDRRAAVRAVELCRSTEAELRAALGAPTRDGLLGRQRILSWIVGEGTVVSYLAVLLDARGVVVDLVWDVPTEIPWTPTDQCGGGAR